LKSAFIHSGEFEKYELSPHHPFKPARSKATYDLCAKFHLFSRDWIEVVEPGPLDAGTMALFHDADYIENLRKANEGKFFDKLIEYGIGTGECPVFRGMYDFAALAAGAAFKGMQLLVEGDCDIAFSPMGGLHHAGRRHAEGFCYINDPGVVIAYLLKHGKRVAYLDLDAHHGNGVQDGFYSEDRVLKISFHETGETLFPWGGHHTEIGAKAGKGYNVNVPFPPGTGDEIYVAAFKEIAPPLIEAFKPDFLLAVMGADVLAADPLTHMNLTNNGMADIAAILRDLTMKRLIVGGGGYNLGALARAWTLAWAVLNGIEPNDEYVGTVGGVFFGETDLEQGGLRDMHVYQSGPPKERIEAAVREVIEYIKANVFPIHGI
jgi:acetoin utilization protein AcuC